MICREAIKVLMFTMERKRILERKISLGLCALQSFASLLVSFYIL